MKKLINLPLKSLLLIALLATTFSARAGDVIRFEPHDIPSLKLVAQESAPCQAKASATVIKYKFINKIPNTPFPVTVQQTDGCVSELCAIKMQPQQLTVEPIGAEYGLAVILPCSHGRFSLYTLSV